MAERPSQAYTCHSKGCANGFGSTFYAAPEDWFAERGFTPPKNCPDCRKWVKAQTDEPVSCKSCRQTRRVPAKYKISHHKRTGPWETPTQCRKCEEGKRPRESAKSKPPRTKRSRPDRKGLLAFAQIADGIPVEARWIETDPRAYEDARHDGETHQMHIEHHIAGSPFSLVEEGGKTATALASGPNSFESFLSVADAVMQSADSTCTRDFLEARGKGRQLVRLTLLADDQHIERTVVDVDSGRVVTSYDTITVAEACDQYGSKDL